MLQLEFSLQTHDVFTVQLTGYAGCIRFWQDVVCNLCALNEREAVQFVLTALHVTALHRAALVSSFLVFRFHLGIFITTFIGLS